ncbi:MAG: hypothetical protein H6825_07280 [Planctomycetes bacterium]|nr:hypothetical protein [Planctomycetota bacterium]
MSAMPPVASVVPHEPPMLMIDALLEYGPGHALSTCVVDHPLFARDGVVDALVTFECMAQTVAACLGCEALGGGGAVRPGMVIACREMRLERPVLEIGERLLFEVTRVRGSESVSHFECETRADDGTLVASTVLTLVHGDSLPE